MLGLKIIRGSVRPFSLRPSVCTFYFYIMLNMYVYLDILLVYVTTSLHQNHISVAVFSFFFFFLNQDVGLFMRLKHQQNNQSGS